MSNPAPGDTVSCKVNDGMICYSHIDFYDRMESFEVICLVENGYLVKVPTRTHLLNSFEVSEAKAKEYGIPKKFVGANVHFVGDTHIVSIREVKDGEFCDKCREYFPMAARNTDGTFKCFLCRTYKYRHGGVK